MLRSNQLFFRVSDVHCERSGPESQSPIQLRSEQAFEYDWLKT